MRFRDRASVILLICFHISGWYFSNASMIDFTDQTNMPAFQRYSPLETNCLAFSNHGFSTNWRAFQNRVDDFVGSSPPSWM